MVDEARGVAAAEEVAQLLQAMWPKAGGGLAMTFTGQPQRALVWRWQPDQAPVAVVEDWTWSEAAAGGVAVRIVAAGGVAGAVWLLPPAGQVTPHWVPGALQMAAGRLRERLCLADAVETATAAVADVGREMAAGLAHRCNNLLTKLELHRTLAIRQGPSPADRHLDAIGRVGGELSDALHLAERLAAGPQPGYRRLQQVAEAVRDGLALFRRLRHLEVTLGDLPDAVAPHHLTACALMLVAADLADYNPDANRFTICGEHSGDGAVLVSLVPDGPSVTLPCRPGGLSGRIAVAAQLIGLAGGSLRMAERAVQVMLPAVPAEKGS
ncbi:MAG TPA: hypothetical protein VD969_06345 [Symbiobacteriaceae bacterium]|nr:hypothetical protein [Symbiobacteriaceae bacterium]